MCKIYVASSWKNKYQELVVQIARTYGCEVFDFKNPPGVERVFSWSDIQSGWELWTTEEYIKALRHPAAQACFESAHEGMVWADIGILVLPCGRSGHLEAGWMKGIGMPVYVFSPEIIEPELMYKLLGEIIPTWRDLCEKLQQLSV